MTYRNHPVCGMVNNKRENITLRNGIRYRRLDSILSIRCFLYIFQFDKLGFRFAATLLLPFFLLPAALTGFRSHRIHLCLLALAHTVMNIHYHPAAHSEINNGKYGYYWTKHDTKIRIIS